MWIGPTRAQFEDLWLAKLKQAQRNYRDTVANWRKTFEERRQSPIPSPDGNYALNRATRVETEARA
jgi:hypothetical protein